MFSFTLDIEREQQSKADSAWREGPASSHLFHFLREWKLVKLKCQGSQFHMEIFSKNSIHLCYQHFVRACVFESLVLIVYLTMFQIVGRWTTDIIFNLPWQPLKMVNFTPFSRWAVWGWGCQVAYLRPHSQEMTKTGSGAADRQTTQPCL